MKFGDLQAALQRGLPLLFLLIFAACSGGYAVRTEVARAALDKGDPKSALAAINKELKVKTADQLPSGLGHSGVLLMLDRGMILQQLKVYQLSSRDLEISDKQIELLDFSRKGLHDLGRYLYSDDTGPYKAPAYEKLMINTVNMLNYLARGDLSGARVEARRFAVMEDYISEHEDPAVTLLPVGRYIAGYVNEASDRVSEAELYYKEAGEKNEIIADLVNQKNEKCPSKEGCGTLLVVMGYGRVPAKEAKRIPIGAAVTMAGSFITPIDAETAVKSLATWVNFPALQRRGRFPDPRVMIDSEAVGGWGVYMLDLEVERAWQQAQPAVVASAITRALARLVAGKAAEAASGGGTLGAILGFATSAGLAAADTPDTRSWATLPARIAMFRRTLPVGEHSMDVSYPGRIDQRRFEIKKDRYATILFNALW